MKKSCELFDLYYHLKRILSNIFENVSMFSHTHSFPLVKPVLSSSNKVPEHLSPSEHPDATVMETIVWLFSIPC